jgi:hypothetical protein
LLWSGATMIRRRPGAHLLPLVFGLLASSACGGSTSGGASATDSGASADAPVAEPDGGFEGGEPEAGNGLVAVALSTCGTAGVYTASATIGESQAFQFVVDTGSASLGVASSSCSGCDVKPEYTPGSSAVDEHQSASSDFGTGAWSGEIYQDTVALGSGAAPVKLVAIDSQHDFFQLFPCTMQGVMGFGPPGAALSGTEVFFDQLAATAHVPDVFATELCDTGGTLWLGGYDPSFTTAAPQYVPMSSGELSQVYYSVNLTSVTVNGTTVPIATAEDADSVVDTGTSGFLLQTAAYDALTAALESNAAFAQVFGASFFSSQGACADVTETKEALDAMLPALTLTFGSNPGVAIPAAPTESYLYPQQSSSWCSALITDPSVFSEVPLASIIGSPILRSNIVIFDLAQKRVGFAPHTACP